MPDDAAIDADLVRRARAAVAVGDMDAARRAGAELWARYERHAFLASRRVARGSERDEVLGHIGLRYTRWLYHSQQELRNMKGLISQMAQYAAGDVTREEAGQPTTSDDLDVTIAVADVDLGRNADIDIADLLAADQIGRLRGVLDEREQRLLDLQLGDLPDAEIAADLDVTTNNLHQIRFRMLDKLRREAARQNEEAGGDPRC